MYKRQIQVILITNDCKREKQPFDYFSFGDSFGYSESQREQWWAENLPTLQKSLNGSAVTRQDTVTNRIIQQSPIPLFLVQCQYWQSHPN